MSWVVLLAAAVLAGVAAGGVLRPFGRGRALTLERLADPLEDERVSLLRALRDLDEERGTGALEEQTYQALKVETEARAVAVLRALEARDGAGALATGIKTMRAEAAVRSAGADGNGRATAGRARSRTALFGTAAVAGVAVAVAAVLLAAAVRAREPGQPITGGIGSDATTSALVFFQQRVTAHPNDLAARLDLAEQYLNSNNVEGAIAQYLAALGIDPKNPEAHAELGFLLFRAGKAEDGLRAVQQALDVQPSYPQALYYKGVILLRGLNRPADAAEAFRAYLAAAPYGALRTEVQDLLKQAETPSA